MSGNKLNRTDLISNNFFVVPLGVTGAFLNFILILIILSSKKLKSPSYVFIINLSISDMLMAIQVSTNYNIDIIMLELSTPICNLLCSLRYTALIACYITSVFSLTMISLYRLEVVLEPFQQNSVKFVFRRPIITNIIMWLISITLSIPMALIIRYNRQVKLCDIIFTFGQVFNIIYFGSLLFLTYFIPITIMILTYRRIGIKLRTTGNITVISRSAGNLTDKTLNNRSKIAIKFLCIATTVYMLLSWPLLASIEIQSALGLTYSVIYQSFPIGAILFVTAFSTTFMVSIINPILYLTYDKNIKTEIQRFRRCKITLTLR